MVLDMFRVRVTLVIVEPGGHVPRDVEGKHVPADFSLGCHAGEEVIAKGIAAVAVSDNELVESIVFGGVEIDSRRAR